MIYNRIREISPTVRDVCITKGGVGMHVAVSIRTTSTTHARDVMLAVLSAGRAKLVVILLTMTLTCVIPSNWNGLLRLVSNLTGTWVVIPDKKGMFLDPSTPALSVTAVMAMDATRPYGQDFAEVYDVPGAETFEVPGWTESDNKVKQFARL